MDFDIDTSTKIIIGIVTAIAGAATYFRAEKLKNASIEADVADLNLRRTTDKGRADEIVTLRDRINSLDTMLNIQSAALSHTMSRISALEASHIGVSMHLDNLLLCNVCTKDNEKILTALHKALEGVDISNIKPGMDY